jgi:hypothetical protein
MGWKNKPTNFIPEVKSDHVDLVKEVEDFIYKRVVVRSPVRDGYFRANHNRSVNEPNYDFDENKTVGFQPQPPVKFGESLFIANGAPYAERLEHGWSDQRPEGVYGVAVIAAREKFKI